MKPLLISLVLAGVAFVQAVAADLGAEYYPVPGDTSLPFSEAVRAGNMLYLAGQLGSDAAGSLVEGGIGAETRQTMENIKAVLADVLGHGNENCLLPGQIEAQAAARTAAAGGLLFTSAEIESLNELAAECGHPSIEGKP